VAVVFVADVWIQKLFKTVFTIDNPIGTQQVNARSRQEAIIAGGKGKLFIQSSAALKGRAGFATSPGTATHACEQKMTWNVE
jgi:hypothetical protein